jgi:GT2 family glycosyltransferase
MSKEKTLHQDEPSIGVAIAVFNGLEHLRRCLQHVFVSKDVKLHVVVCDDGSTDGTRAMLASDFPSVHVIRGDGEQWWTGGTNRAVEHCLMSGCDYVLLLNPDVFLAPEALKELLKCSQQASNGVAAALVASEVDKRKVAWAGSRLGKLGPLLPIWVMRYIYSRGTPLSELPDMPFSTDEVHGRGVLVPSSVFRRCGLHDERTWPHYGADCDFSRRLLRQGIPMHVVPAALATLDVENTGLLKTTPESFFQQWKGFLTDRKSGNALSTQWNLARHHLPWYGQIPTYLFGLSFSSFLLWQRVRRAKSDAKHVPAETSKGE